jgi:hypothetical protein
MVEPIPVGCVRRWRLRSPSPWVASSYVLRKPTERSLIIHFTLPHYKDFPSEGFEGFVIPLVTLKVGLKLSSPECPIRFWHVGKTTAGMLVPEASPDLDCRPIPRQDEIRLPR